MYICSRTPDLTHSIPSSARLAYSSIRRRTIMSSNQEAKPLWARAMKTSWPWWCRLAVMSTSTEWRATRARRTVSWLCHSRRKAPSSFSPRGSERECRIPIFVLWINLKIIHFKTQIRFTCLSKLTDAMTLKVHYKAERSQRNRAMLPIYKYTLWGIKKHTKFFYRRFYNTWPILIEIDVQCLG